MELGVPVRLRPDGSPQFASYEFWKFMDRWGVNHDFSAPHFPRSNGHAKTAVKAIKTLVAKTTHGGNVYDDAFCRGLLEWRNTPGTSGRSPVQILFGQPTQTAVHGHQHTFSPQWQRAAHECDAQAAEVWAKTSTHYDQSSKPKIRFVLAPRCWYNIHR